jgi:23S rRNA (cytosine1962-C5)-methyltransferase
LAIDATAYRLIHGEADLLPSLIVDRYGDYLSVQALSQGMDRLLPDVVRVLSERLRPAGIIARNDPRSRSLEGLEQRVEVLAGEVPETVMVREVGIEYDVDLRRGQKTGLFLDQRENRAAAAQYRTRSRARLLQLSTAVSRWCSASALPRRLPFDVSEEAVARIGQNATAQRRRRSMPGSATCSTNCVASNGSASGLTRSCSIRRPSPKTRRRSPNARAGYKEINLRALKLLNPRRHAGHLQLFVQR